MQMLGSTLALAGCGEFDYRGRSVKSAAIEPGPSNPLATRQQIEAEDLAIHLYGSSAVQQAMERGRQIMRRDPRAATESGQATVESDLQELSFAACAITAVADPTDPKVYWSINLPHRWFGRSVPGSRCGIDNPDNAYRLIALHEQSSYRLTGRVPPEPPADVSFTVFPVWPGVIDAEGIFPAALGGISLKEIELDASGHFALSLDATPAQGRRNHVQLKPGTCNLFVRDSMSDWSRETPLYLAIERLSGPAAPPEPRDQAALVQQAARNVDRSVRFWLDLPSKYYYLAGPNRMAVTTNPAIAKGGQFTGNSHFELTDDQAYVLTLAPQDAAYVSVQLADLYGASLEYADHTSSLNASQVVANADGTLTYVLSRRDPGVHNWLDPVGLDRGLIMFRYQGYDAERLRLDAAVQMERVVALSQLDTVLPAHTRRVTLGERRRQLAERRAAYDRRLVETPFGNLPPTHS